MACDTLRQRLSIRRDESLSWEPRRGAREAAPRILRLEPSFVIDPEWHAILSGRRRDWSASLWRGALRLAVPGYAAAVAARNWLFDAGLRSVHRAALPVVSVGNLTTGGVGKTPVAAWIVQELQRLGARPGLLSRGYGGDGSANDERLVLDALCPGVPHLQQPDRVAGAAALSQRRDCDVIVLDDGFQHRRLARDLDLALLDALVPWGYGSLLPRGLLREPPSALRRADLVGITRVDQCDSDALAELRATIARHTAAPIVEIVFQPRRLLSADGATAGFELLRQPGLGALCAIGNPQAFRRTLRDLGAAIDDDRFRALPDHHRFAAADRTELVDWLRRAGITRLAVTQKDLVKLRTAQLGEAEVWAVEIGAEFRSGESELRRRLAEFAGRVGRLAPSSWSRP